jgi:hypothetical protein
MDKTDPYVELTLGDTKRKTRCVSVFSIYGNLNLNPTRFVELSVAPVTRICLDTTSGNELLLAN